jgi:hypothetical protein
MGRQPEANAIEVARYVTGLTAQLEAMAGVAGLELLRHFLSMANAEGRLLALGNAQADVFIADEQVELATLSPSSIPLQDYQLAEMPNVQN